MNNYLTNCQHDVLSMSPPSPVGTLGGFDIWIGVHVRGQEYDLAAHAGKGDRVQQGLEPLCSVPIVLACVLERGV